jgi:hypothetical protein
MAYRIVGPAVKSYLYIKKPVQDLPHHHHLPIKKDEQYFKKKKTRNKQKKLGI